MHASIFNKTDQLPTMVNAVIIIEHINEVMAITTFY